MGRTLTRSGTQRKVSILLALSLVPMLTFMGHWPAAVPIPGTDQYLSVPFAGHASEEEEGAHDHSQHCHGDSASCSDVPALAGTSFALMEEVLAVFTAGGLLWAAALQWWMPLRPNSLLPELQPPRMALG